MSCWAEKRRTAVARWMAGEHRRGRGRDRLGRAENGLVKREQRDAANQLIGLIQKILARR